MLVHIDASSAVPAYEQLRSQIAAAIRTGQLEQGHRLPPIRQLAKDLELAPGTVARAYRQLETAGFVTSNGRRGTHVAGVAQDAGRNRARLKRAADDLAVVALSLDLTAEEACHALQAAIVARTRSSHDPASSTDAP